MPLVIPLTYHLLLPSPSAFASVALPSDEDSGLRDDSESATPYTALPTDDASEPVADALMSKVAGGLSPRDKWRLVKPLLPKYMLPLCMFFSIFYYVKRNILTFSIPSRCVSGRCRVSRSSRSLVTLTNFCSSNTRLTR